MNTAMNAALLVGQPIHEQERMRSLWELIPESCATALDIGCRRGKITRMLVDTVEHVTAMDLVAPCISHERITCTQGDITSLECNDNAYDLVVCTEVLEHIPPAMLETACHEIVRVARRVVLIGVPYRQDIRIGRMKCGVCGMRNPPWGHLNSFDERRLQLLFSPLTATKWAFVGKNRERTNCVSTWLMDLAGNPYGPYGQEERCIGCGCVLLAPPARNVFQ